MNNPVDLFGRSNRSRGKTSGAAILGPAQLKQLLRDYEVLTDPTEPFSTVMIFGVKLHQPPTANDDRTDAVAHIHFGTAWNPIDEDDCQDVDVDLCNGMAINVLGNCMINIEVEYGPLLFAEAGATQPVLEVSLSIARGFHPNRARRTVKIGPLAALTASPILDIPNFAKEAILVNADPTVPSLRMDQFLNAQGGVPISTDFVIKKPDQAVQAADGAEGFAVTTGATPTTKTAVIWNLFL
jgi:hypothetical protein